MGYCLFVCNIEFFLLVSWQFETWQALTIVLEVEGQWEWYNLSVAYLTINFQNTFSKSYWRAFNSHMVFYFTIKNSPVTFEISDRYYNPLQNLLTRMNKFEKRRILMESLVAVFLQFSSIIKNFLFLQRWLGRRLCMHSMLISFQKFPHSF